MSLNELSACVVLMHKYFSMYLWSGFNTSTLCLCAIAHRKDKNKPLKLKPNIKLNQVK